jgi:hypothetical protein
MVDSLDKEIQSMIADLKDVNLTTISNIFDELKPKNNNTERVAIKNVAVLDRIMTKNVVSNFETTPSIESLPTLNFDDDGLKSPRVNSWLHKISQNLSSNPLLNLNRLSDSTVIERINSIGYVRKASPPLENVELSNMHQESKTSGEKLIRTSLRSADKGILPVAKKFFISIQKISQEFDKIEYIGLVTFTETKSIHLIEKKLNQYLADLIKITKNHSTNIDSSGEISTTVRLVLDCVSSIVNVMEGTKHEVLNLDCPDERLKRESILNTVDVVDDDNEPFEIGFLVKYVQFQSDRIVSTFRKVFFKPEISEKESKEMLASVDQIINNIIYETKSTMDCFVTKESQYRKLDLIIYDLESAKSKLGEYSIQFLNENLTDEFSESIYETSSRLKSLREYIWIICKIDLKEE